MMRSYLRQFVEYFNDCDVTEITPLQMKTYMLYLRTEYVPKRFNGKIHPLSGSALDNRWKSYRAFWKWCGENLGIKRPDSDLPQPKYALPEISVFTTAEIHRMVKSAKYSLEIKKTTCKPYKLKLPHAERDTVIILVLLDTGLRIGEFCRLKVGDVDLETGEIIVQPFRSSKKSKPRTVYVGLGTRRAIWLYQSTFQRPPLPDDPLIGLSASSIRHTLQHIGIKAGVSDVHPHRFRHTFATAYLKNGGDIFSLQRILGHSSLEMVNHYLSLVNADLNNAHRKASPVDNMKL